MSDEAISEAMKTHWLCGQFMQPVYEILRVGVRPNVPTGIIEQFAGYYCPTCNMGGIENPR